MKQSVSEPIILFYLGLEYYKDNKSGNKRYKFLSKDSLGKQLPLIYDFDSYSWRIVDERGMSLKGNIYWIASHVTERQLGITLLRFEFLTEKSQPVPLPYECSWYANICLSVVREEKLSVLVQLEYISKTEILVTNKIDETTKVVSWSPDLQLSYEGSFFLDEEKKVVMCCERWISDIDVTMTKYVCLLLLSTQNK